MKGRPLADWEFDRLLEATPLVVGDQASKSWQYLLRGAVTSGLRLSELMHISWDIPQTIRPVWRDGQEPVLWFPTKHLQKNRKRQRFRSFLGSLTFSWKRTLTCGRVGCSNPCPWHTGHVGCSRVTGCLRFGLAGLSAGLAGWRGSWWTRGIRSRVHPPSTPVSTTCGGRSPKELRTLGYRRSTPSN